MRWLFYALSIAGALGLGYWLGQSRDPEHALNLGGSVRHDEQPSRGPTLQGRELSDATPAEVVALQARIRDLEGQLRVRERLSAEPDGAQTSESRLEAYRRAQIEFERALSALQPEDSYVRFPTEAAGDGAEIAGWGMPSAMFRKLSADDVSSYTRWLTQRAPRYTLSRLPRAVGPSTAASAESVIRDWVEGSVRRMLEARAAWRGLSGSQHDQAYRRYLHDEFDRRSEVETRLRELLKADKDLGPEGEFVRIELLP